MKVKIKGKTSEVKRIYINAKCSDLCYAELKNDEGIVASRDGYVPGFMPGEHYGDYVELEIDLETGTILNWKKPTAKDIAATDWNIIG
jgi:hypothetical protein